MWTDVCVSSHILITFISPFFWLFIISCICNRICCQMLWLSPQKRMLMYKVSSQSASCSLSFCSCLSESLRQQEAWHLQRLTADEQVWTAKASSSHQVEDSVLQCRMNILKFLLLDLNFFRIGPFLSLLQCYILNDYKSWLCACVYVKQTSAMALWSVSSCISSSCERCFCRFNSALKGTLIKEKNIFKKALFSSVSKCSIIPIHLSVVRLSLRTKLLQVVSQFLFHQNLWCSTSAVALSFIQCSW